MLKKMNYSLGLATLVIINIFMQQNIVNMNLQGPFTKEQKDKARIVMAKIYCKAANQPNKKIDELREELSGELESLKLPIEIQYLPELIKDMKPHADGKQC